MDRSVPLENISLKRDSNKPPGLYSETGKDTSELELLMCVLLQLNYGVCIIQLILFFVLSRCAVSPMDNEG